MVESDPKNLIDKESYQVMMNIAEYWVDDTNSLDSYNANGLLLDSTESVMNFYDSSVEELDKSNVGDHFNIKDYLHERVEEEEAGRLKKVCNVLRPSLS